MKNVKPWEVCEYKDKVDDVGNILVFLKEKCPYAHRLKYHICVLKSDCRECEKVRKAKEKGEDVPDSFKRNLVSWFNKTEKKRR